MIIVSDKYTKNKDGAEEDLNEVIDEQDQVAAILNWLENKLPGVVLGLSGDKSEANQISEAKDIVPKQLANEVPKSQAINPHAVSNSNTTTTTQLKKQTPKPQSTTTQKPQQNITKQNTIKPQLAKREPVKTNLSQAKPENDSENPQKKKSILDRIKPAIGGQENLANLVSTSHQHPQPSKKPFKFTKYEQADQDVIQEQPETHQNTQPLQQMTASDPFQLPILDLNQAMGHASIVSSFSNFISNSKEKTL